MSKHKYLKLDTCLTQWDLPGIASLLRCSSELEELVINMSSSTCFRSGERKGFVFYCALHMDEGDHSGADDLVDYGSASVEEYSSGAGDSVNEGSSQVSTPETHSSDLSSYAVVDSPRRQRRRGATPDRISALQDSILIHILSFLPIKDAVCTGVCSRRWQFLWTLVPALAFRNPSSNSDYSYEFCDFVDQVLILHSTPSVKKFSVDFEYVDSLSPRVDLWIRFAVTREVEELSLDFLGSDVDDIDAIKRGEIDLYKLPLHLFSNEKLTRLALRYCCFELGMIRFYWTSLRNLSLSFIKLSNRMIDDILFGCPALEVFELHACSGYDTLAVSCSSKLKKLTIHGGEKHPDLGSELTISGPPLRTLEIFGNFYGKFNLVKLSSLADVHLNFQLLGEMGDKANVEYCNFFKRLLDSLHHVKNLTVGAWCIQVLSIQEVMGMFAPLSKCKYLKLDTCLAKWDFPGILSLLQSSPDLQELVINVRDSTNFWVPFGAKFIDSHDFDGKSYWVSRNSKFQCLDSSLKTVKISGFTGGVCDIEIVQFLLKRGMVLEKMVICGNLIKHSKHSKSRKRKPEDLLIMSQKMLRLPRASPNAVILFS